MNIIVKYYERGNNITKLPFEVQLIHALHLLNLVLLSLAFYQFDHVHLVLHSTFLAIPQNQINQSNQKFSDYKWIPISKNNSHTIRRTNRGEFSSFIKYFRFFLLWSSFLILLFRCYQPTSREEHSIRNRNSVDHWETIACKWHENFKLMAKIKYKSKYKQFINNN